MIERAHRDVVAEDVRPGWLITSPSGLATVTSVHFTTDGVDIGYRPFPRSSGNSLHLQAKPGDRFTRFADDDILDQIEAVIVAAVLGNAPDVEILRDGSAVLVTVDDVEWTMRLRSHARAVRPADPDGPEA